MVAAASSGDEYAGLGILGGIVLILGAMIGGIIGSQVAVPSKIDNRFVWLKKVAPEFLAELPVWTWAPNR